MAWSGIINSSGDGMFKLGQTEVSRVEEYMGVCFPPSMLLPDWTAEAVAPHMSWLAPTHYDVASDLLIGSNHTWVIRDRHHTILIDTCAGNHKPRPELPIFNMLDTPYLDRLAAAGVSPDEVDYVFCTHLHVDHVGWNTKLAHGKWKPTFPNAKYLFSRNERENVDPAYRTDGTGTEDPEMYRDSVLPLLESGQALIFDGELALGDNLLLSPAPGHTPGQCMATLTGGSKDAVFTGDVMHHPIQVYNPDWNSAFCHDQVAARRTRRSILERAVERDTIVCPTHFAGSHCCKIGPANEGFVCRSID